MWVLWNRQIWRVRGCLWGLISTCLWMTTLTSLMTLESALLCPPSSTCKAMVPKSSSPLTLYDMLHLFSLTYHLGFSLLYVFYFLVTWILGLYQFFLFHVGFVVFGLLISVTYSKKDFFWTFHCFSTVIFILLLFFVMFHPDLYGIGFDVIHLTFLFSLYWLIWKFVFRKRRNSLYRSFCFGKVFSWVYVLLFIFYSIANCKSGFTCFGIFRSIIFHGFMILLFIFYSHV